MIKFFDIYKQDKIFHPILFKKIKKLFKKGDYILGNEVKEFENNFKNYCGSKYAVSCGNGTDALTLALKSLNLPKNSEIILADSNWIATLSPIIHLGYKPVLVDVDIKNWCIDPKKIENKI